MDLYLSLNHLIMLSNQYSTMNVAITIIIVVIFMFRNITTITMVHVTFNLIAIIKRSKGYQLVS
jgi:hypothetical protein